MTNDNLQRLYWEKEHCFRAYNHPVVESFARQRIDLICRTLPVSSIVNALDVGCGDGFSTYYMNERIPAIVGVDRSNMMAQRHPLKGNGQVAIADALRLPFADESFDLVYGWEILHHLMKPEHAIAEMSRVGRRYVLIFEPNPLNIAQFGFALLDREHRLVLRYSPRFMRALFRKAGLKIVAFGSGGWIFPNKTPMPLLPLLEKIPYGNPFGISNWVLGMKPAEEKQR